MSDLHIRFTVHASFSVTLSVDEATRLPGPLLRGVIAENVDSMLDASGTIFDAIDSISIDEVATDQDETIVSEWYGMFGKEAS